MTRINQLQIIFQKPIDPEEYGISDEDQDEYIFVTGGQSEVKKLVQVGLDKWNENTLDIIEANIPVGVAGMSDIIRRAVIRHIANRKEWDSEWQYFYCIAAFERADRSAFFRTVIPRTQLGMAFRRLRHRNTGNRKDGVRKRGNVRRRKV